MYADNFLRLNCFDYFLDCLAVSMTRGVYVHYIVEHTTELLVLWVCFHLLWILVITIPRRVDEKCFFLGNFYFLDKTTFAKQTAYSVL